jgi:hypothetical protein
MRFRLTYEGALPSTQGNPRGAQNDPRAPAKHKLRQVFHRQLKRLWEVNPNLVEPRAYERVVVYDAPKPPTPENLAREHAHYGWNFVPLVTESLGVGCALDVLLLRPTPRHKDSWFGDIDNRLKTLIDALQIPSANELYVNHPPESGEDPFYCLIENDKMLTRVSAETDEMLQPVELKNDEPNVRLVISVEVRPLYINMRNLPFA